MTTAQPFGDFRVRIDPWEVDYGDQTPLAPTDDQSDEQVDHEIEVSDANWQAITPTGDPTPASVWSSSTG